MLPRFRRGFFLAAMLLAGLLLLSCRGGEKEVSKTPGATQPAGAGTAGAQNCLPGKPDPSAPLVTADDIPVAYTPGCGWDEFPPPILETCNEPLVPEAPDLRGLWEAYSGMVGHIERIEQCGNRVVITAGGVIHDMRADGTLENGVNDVSGWECQPIEVAAEFVDGQLQLRPFGGPVAVTRELDGEELVWVFAGSISRLKRICNLPE